MMQPFERWRVPRLVDRGFLGDGGSLDGQMVPGVTEDPLAENMWPWGIMCEGAALNFVFRAKDKATCCVREVSDCSSP